MTITMSDIDYMIENVHRSGRSPDAIVLAHVDLLELRREVPLHIQQNEFSTENVPGTNRARITIHGIPVLTSWDIPTGTMYVIPEYPSLATNITNSTHNHPAPISRQDFMDAYNQIADIGYRQEDVAVHVGGSGGGGGNLIMPPAWMVIHEREPEPIDMFEAGQREMENGNSA